MTTAIPVLADLLDAIVHRLSDIATDLRSDLSSPALAEVRAAIAAAERAFVLLSPWVPHGGDVDPDDILAAVEKFIIRNDGIPMPPDEHFTTATIEASTMEGGPDEHAKVTMPGCVYLVQGETDSIDDEDYSTKTIWSVVGRYPQ